MTSFALGRDHWLALRGFVGTAIDDQLDYVENYPEDIDDVPAMLQRIEEVNALCQRIDATLGTEHNENANPNPVGVSHATDHP